MKRTKLLAAVLTTMFLFLAITGGIAAAENAAARTITDMAGRTVTVAQTISSLCATGQPGAVMLYTLCPEMLVAWNSALTEDSLPYIPSEMAALPVIGSMQGGKTSVNPEEVLALRPDVIIYMTTLTKNTSAKADEIQAQMSTPVITISFDLTNLGESYRFLGSLLGIEDQAETLAAFCDTLIADIQVKSETIAPDDQITFYYTSGGNGLQTSPGGTNHTEMFEFTGGVNAVDLPAESNGRLKVDMERILAWNPDVVIAASPAVLSSVLQWEHVNAVTAGASYSAPTAPFSWLDAPVSVNRLIGLCWAAETLYPDVYQYDLEAYAQEFYSLFYRYDLSAEELDSMMP